MEKNRLEKEIINDKARFLQDYPALSHNRFRAFDYRNYDQTWNTAQNISGFKWRVSRLLGINDIRRHTLSHYSVELAYRFQLWPSDRPQPITDSPLWTSLCTYPTQAAAQQAQAKALQLAQQPQYYRPTTYHKVNSHRWEIVDSQQQTLAVYTPYFSSQKQLNTALPNLLAY